MIMTFHNVNIFYKVCIIFDLSSALACRVESIKQPEGKPRFMCGEEGVRESYAIMHIII